MNKYQFISASILLSSAFLAAGCSMNAQTGVRAGNTEIAATERVVDGEVNRWVRTVGTVGEDPSVSNITSTAVRTGFHNDFKEAVELVYPPEEREQVKRNLENASYFDVEITANGVSYYTETFADEAMRSILERHNPTVEYTPHDCSRVIGVCAYTAKYAGTEPLHYLRTSEFKNGTWTDRVNYDPERDPAGRTDVVEERRFSVAPSGVIKAMDQKFFLKDGIWEVKTRHVERVLPNS